MDDSIILQKVSDLTDEEKRLEDSHEHEALSGVKLARLRAIEIELDQCWDLLRRRRARRAPAWTLTAPACGPKASWRTTNSRESFRLL